MNYDQLAYAFNRALTHTLSKKKFLLTFVVLALGGLFLLFLTGLKAYVTPWVSLSLSFLPIFFGFGLLLPLGILLIRVYHQEVKNKPIDCKELLKRSWEIMLGASYLMIPIILCYLVLWVVAGIFTLLQETPHFGEIVSILLAFIPFIIHFMMVLLVILCLASLHLLSPLFALKGLQKETILPNAVQRLIKDPFANLLLLFIALIPIGITLVPLLFATHLTTASCLSCEAVSKTMIRSFFIMLPFAAVLTPAVIFFFNFSVEAYLLTNSSKTIK